MKISPREIPPLSPRDRQIFGFDQDDQTWLSKARSSLNVPVLGHLGPFTLIEEIGRGGQGIVYLARRKGTRATFALKRIRGSCLGRPATRRRLERELAVLSVLDHRSIVKVIGIDVVEEEPCLSMEWIQGRPITEWAKSKQGDVQEISRAFIDVCDGVRHAHQHAVIHRDLKPSNILVDGDGAAKILDFGLAKILGHQEADWTREFMGTPEYAAPEQRAGQSPPDARSDVYSLSVILYELLVGRSPFEDRSRSRDLPIPRPSQVRPELRGDLDSICLTGLHPDPDSRYQSVDALMGDIRRYLEGIPVQAHPPTLSYYAAKMIRRHRWSVGLASVAMVVLLTLTSLVAIQSVSLREERDAATSAQDREARARQLAENEKVRAETVLRFLIDDVLRFGEARAGATDRPLSSVIENASRRQDRLASKPLAHAVVLDVLGDIAASVGRFEDAVDYLEKALQVAQQSSLDELSIADIESGLAMAYDMRGDYSSASLHHRSACDVAWRFGDEPRALAILANAGTHSLESGEFALAQRLLDEALGRATRLDSGSSLRASIEHNLGRLCLERGDFLKARDLVEAALKRHEEISGPESLEVGWDRIQLGHIGAALGNLDDARENYERGLELVREFLDGPHPDEIPALLGLAHVSLRLGQPDKSFSYSEDALEIAESRPVNPNRLSRVQATMGLTHLRSGDVRKGRELLRKACVTAQSGFPNHPETARHMVSLAQALWTESDPDLAEIETLLMQARVIEDALLRSDHPSRLTTLAWLARVRSRQGHTNDARDAWEEALDLSPPGDPNRDEDVLLYARHLYDSLQHDEVEMLLEDAMDSRESRLAPTDPWWVTAELVLAMSRLATGQAEAVRARLEDLAPGVRRRYGSDHAVYLQLANLLEAASTGNH